jgi:hypothetical protein
MRTRREAALVGVVALTLALGTRASGQTYYGEPVVLKGRSIYFTSWKYVRPGQFAWRIERDPTAGPADQNVGAWLKGDGTRPARFETLDMPRGIRLVAQPATKLPFQPGQLAATLYDPADHKYKAWYTVPPCPGPESFSSKEAQYLRGYHQVPFGPTAGDIPENGARKSSSSRAIPLVLRASCRELPRKQPFSGKLTASCPAKRGFLLHLTTATTHRFRESSQMAAHDSFARIRPCLN